MDKVGFLQLKQERCSVFTVLNYEFYATLDPATGTQVEQAPPEKRSEKAPKYYWKKFSPQLRVCKTSKQSVTLYVPGFICQF